jgi:hypothetical protein
LGPADLPVDADVEFEGLAFSNGATLTGRDFEFNATAHARVSPAGTSMYSVTLPQGVYRVTVRPASDGAMRLDGGGLPAVQVTSLVVDDRHTYEPFTLGGMRQISGSAATADGRPLVGATVEAIPVSCDQPANLADGGDAGSQLKQPGTTAACVPRPQQVIITDTQGSFSLPLDPGGYQLRVKPADGTGFPWVTQSLDPAAATVRLKVPAPFHTSFSLLDANDVPVMRALVKAFLVPDPSDPSSSAQAVELGETLTDGSGQCDLYLDLAPPP